LRWATEGSMGDAVAFMCFWVGGSGEPKR
jgi:hypothetical protein